MAVKTPFFDQDFTDILSRYEVGTYLRSDPVAQGTVQTNYFLLTTLGKFVFRYYENRSLESVRFECNLLAFLAKHAYPCPAPVRGRRGTAVGVYRDKPFMLFEFIAGQPLDHPDDHHTRQLIQKAAELHNLTRRYRPRYHQYRWNYSPELCRTLARAAAANLNTPDAWQKLAWLEQQLAALQLPPALPKGICHCDFDISNVLFQDNQFVALLDFDDANYTYLLYDLVGLIESAAWPYTAPTLDLHRARAVVRDYLSFRPLNALERHHLYDVLRLSILIDCVWFFGRGSASDFYEKRKIDHLDELGRKRFFEELFLP